MCMEVIINVNGKQVLTNYNTAATIVLWVNILKDD